MKKQFITLVAIALFSSACNKSDQPGPASYGGPCPQPNKEDVPGYRKLKPTDKISAGNTGTLTQHDKDPVAAH